MCQLGKFITGSVGFTLARFALLESFSMTATDELFLSRMGSKSSWCLKSNFKFYSMNLIL